MKNEKIAYKKLTPLLHVGAWLIVFLLPYLFRFNPAETHAKMPDPPPSVFYTNTFTGLFLIVIFYLNASILIKNFVYKKRWAVYLLILLGLFLILICWHFMFFCLFNSYDFFRLLNSIGFNLPTYLLTLAVSISYRMLIDRAKADKIAEEKQKETLRTELAFLRSQISPHFMFNVLNNILALARLKSDQLEPTIFKLSSLMRYMLYETQGEKVILSKEIDYLSNYIDLQRQRLGSRVNLEVDFKVEDYSAQIAPMLLIPFIENAFKHGTGNAKSTIEMKLWQRDHELNFSIRNRRTHEGLSKSVDETSGIGLANVRRRLKLLYPNGHKLIINRNDDWFSVNLQLNLL